MSGVVEHFIDAPDEATFVARLEALTRAGAMLHLSGVAVGAELVVEAVSRDGARRARAHARVLAVAQDTVQVALGPFAHLDEAAQMQLEGARTAAVPITVAPVLREPATGPGSSAPKSATSLSMPTQPSGPPELEAFDQLGTYQLLKHLGGGGMAEVYLARARLGGDVDKLVALKTAREGFGPATPYGAMFLDEARVSATLQHPNLIQVFDFGEALGRPYLAMEFIAGRDLSVALKEIRARRTPADPAVVVAIGIALCRALEHVHDKRDAEGRPLGLVHRDVGPANVMVTLKDEIKLMDFGVAATAARQATSSGKDALMVGKLPYMPAQQLLGLEPSPSWDLYAVGVTLYQLVSLFHPWQGNPLEYLPTPALRFHRGAPSGLSPAIPPELDALLVKATQLEEADRPATARQLREELEAVQRITGVGDVGAWVRSLFGPELEREEAEAQALLVEGRKRSASSVPGFLKPLLVPFEAVRRVVVYSALYRRLARRPALLRSLMALVALLLVAPVAWGVSRSREEARLTKQLQAIDAQLVSGRLTGAGNDDALDLLVAAREGAPGEARFLARTKLLAERLEGLGLLALERGNLEEAAAHLEAALRAEPGRAASAQGLKKVEEHVKERSRSRVVQSP